MFRMETVFRAQAVLTPDFAAKLANRASRYASAIYLERENTRLYVDSLIGLLSLTLRSGMAVTVIAEGEDAQQAAEDICALLRGEN